MIEFAIGIAIGVLGTILSAVVVARIYCWANPVEHKPRVDAEEAGW